jgi:DNA-binding Lrp family transcriptional regulator
MMPPPRRRLPPAPRPDYDSRSVPALAEAPVTVVEVTVVQAYILIQTEVGKAAQVAKEVAAIKGVTQAEDVTGPYDVIVRAEARNVDDLGKLVVAKIQAVEGITRTLTCPVVHL